MFIGSASRQVRNEFADGSSHYSYFNISASQNFTVELPALWPKYSSSRVCGFGGSSANCQTVSSREYPDAFKPGPTTRVFTLQAWNGAVMLQGYPASGPPVRITDEECGRPPEPPKESISRASLPAGSDVPSQPPPALPPAPAPEAPVPTPAASETPPQTSGDRTAAAEALLAVGAKLNGAAAASAPAAKSTGLGRSLLAAEAIQALGSPPLFVQELPYNSTSNVVKPLMDFAARDVPAPDGVESAIPEANAYSIANNFVVDIETTRLGMDNRTRQMMADLTGASVNFASLRLNSSISLI
eukprot:tig00000025_g7947.t1